MSPPRPRHSTTRAWVGPAARHGRADPDTKLGGGQGERRWEEEVGEGRGGGSHETAATMKARGVGRRRPWDGDSVWSPRRGKATPMAVGTASDVGKPRTTVIGADPATGTGGGERRGVRRVEGGGKRVRV